MNTFSIALLIFACILFSCTPDDLEETGTDPVPEVEYITWKLNGAGQSASPIQKVLSEIETGYINFSDGGVSQFYFEFEDAGNFVLDSLYNLPDYEDYDLGFDGTSPIDTFFTEGTFRLTRNDATWVEGEFSGDSAKTNDAGLISDIPLVLTEGKFKLHK